MAPPPTRRGWCPGVLTPMPTDDGLLVRLHPPAGALTADQARAVAGAARACGNGHLDVTGRGNLQIRGVRVESHPALVERLAAVGLVEPAGHAGAGFGAASRQVVALGPGLPSAIASGIRERGWSLYARTNALFPDGCSEAEPSPGPSATTCE